MAAASGCKAIRRARPSFAARCRSIAHRRRDVPAPVVFLIDDHASVRHALGEMLNVFGCTVESYESADRFLTTFDRKRLGCIVSDVRMPGTDGIKLVHELARRDIRIP